jgi:hypothetical protein
MGVIFYATFPIFARAWKTTILQHSGMSLRRGHSVRVLLGRSSPRCNTAPVQPACGQLSRRWGPP